MSALYAWLRRHPMLVDSVLAAALLFGGVGATFAKGMFLGIPLGLGLVVPVVFRRKHPVAAYYTAVAAGGLQVALDARPATTDVAILILLYTLAAYTPRRTSVWGLAVCLAGSAVGVLRWISLINHSLLEWLTAGAMLFAGPALLAWVLGDSMRYRRAYYASLEDRAARLETERDAQAKVAAAAERARIARELHDVIAHNVSVMVVQADGASYALGTDPDRAREALAAISATGRQALAEMRRLLGVLRREEDGRLRAGAPARHRRAGRTARPGAQLRGCRCRSPSRGPRSRCPAASRLPPTGSCRSPSPTPASTQARSSRRRSCFATLRTRWC